MFRIFGAPFTLFYVLVDISIPVFNGTTRAEVDISYQWMRSHDSTTEPGINCSVGLNFLFVQIKQFNFMSTTGIAFDTDGNIKKI